MKSIKLMSVTELNPQDQSITRRQLKSRYVLYGKRFFDLVIAISSLIILLPMMAIISLIIVLNSPGSPIFIQERVGRKGKRFYIYKFRTMENNYDSENDRAFMQAYISGQLDEDPENKDVYKPNNHSKITRFGKILRVTSLDELPQILNILKGDMSLVGPRPNVAWEVEKYSDWHKGRLRVLPGITGLAQVRGRSSLSFKEMLLR